MATYKKCDRCRKLSDKITDYTVVHYPQLGRNREIYDQEKTAEICIQCVVDLEKFMQPLPGEARSA